MFEPFKAPSNNHQGFGQGDGAEHTTVKEFVEGVNKYFAALFGYGTPAVDPAIGAAAGVLAEGVDNAHSRITDLEEGMTTLQRQFDALLAAIPAPDGFSITSQSGTHTPNVGKIVDGDPVPIEESNAVPSPTALVPDDAGVKSPPVEGE